MSTPLVRASFARLSRQETLLTLPGALPLRPLAPPSPRSTREVLEEILTDALTTAPTYVLFSGGRDSSALLALTAHLARRHGMPEPVPVTVRHPDAPESHETVWQELVLEHLHLREHVVLEFRGEQSLLGGTATDALRRHGVVWPEAIQLHGAVYRHLDPGVVVSGEGGDFLLASNRMGALRNTFTRPRRSSLRRGLRAALPALQPRTPAPVPPWLRPAAVVAYRRQLAAAGADPLRWDTAMQGIMRSRAVEVFTTNFEAAVSEYGSRPVTPFTDPRVVAALAREAGPLGWGDRTAMFRRLFHDVLPDEVLRRRSKAAFNSTRWGTEERDFARGWDGNGLDPEWVDPEALRAAWLADVRPPAAGFLLHVAWARAHGVPSGLEDLP